MSSPDTSKSHPAKLQKELGAPVRENETDNGMLSREKLCRIDDGIKALLADAAKSKLSLNCGRTIVADWDVVPTDAVSAPMPLTVAPSDAPPLPIEISHWAGDNPEPGTPPGMTRDEEFDVLV